MTHIFKDGFDLVDPTVWTLAGAGPAGAGSSNYNTITPRTGPICARLNNNPRWYRDLTVSEEDDGMFVGVGVNLGADQTNTFPVIQLFEAQGATEHIYLECNGSSRGWRVGRGTWPGTVLIDILPNVLFRSTWHFMELGVKIADSGGTIELRQDGATIATFTGDTKNGATDGLIDRVQFRGPGTQEFRIDDVYINNEQGSAPDNTFWGDTRLFPQYPNGNGNYSQLVGSDGNSTDNYLLVDEVGAAVESDYVGSTVDGNKDTYPFEDLAVTTGMIRGVEIRMHAWKTEAGNKAIRSVARRSSTDALGDDKVLALTGAPHKQMYPQDPIAAAAWTIPNFNGTEFGVEVQDF